MSAKMRITKTVEDLLDRLSSIAEHIGLPHDTATLSSFVSSGGIGLQHSASLKMHNSLCSWRQYYPVVSFLTRKMVPIMGRASS